jgi:hypothetical protein
MEINTEKIAQMSDADLLAWKNDILTKNDLYVVLLNEQNKRREQFFLQSQPFVFTDWFNELAEQNKVPKIWAVEYKNKRGEPELIVWVHEFDMPLFQGCQIPTTAQQAEFLFKAFNLL